MSSDVHERARRLALSTRIEHIAAPEREWLDTHLSGCEACRGYDESVERALGGVRSMAASAGDELVRATQLRVRQRAAELRARNAVMRPLWIASAMVFLSTLLSTPLLWQGFAWLGRVAQLPNLAWRAAFVLFWVAPVIAASILLLAYGSHLERWRETKFSRGEL